MRTEPPSATPASRGFPQRLVGGWEPRPRARLERHAAAPAHAVPTYRDTRAEIYLRLWRAEGSEFPYLCGARNFIDAAPYETSIFPPRARSPARPLGLQRARRGPHTCRRGAQPKPAPQAPGAHGSAPLRGLGGARGRGAPDAAALPSWSTQPPRGGRGATQHLELPAQGTAPQPARTPDPGRVPHYALRPLPVDDHPLGQLQQAQHRAGRHRPQPAALPPRTARGSAPHLPPAGGPELQAPLPPARGRPRACRTAAGAGGAG